MQLLRREGGSLSHVLVVFLAFGACSETPNFQKPSTGDFLFRYDELQDHLRQRRSVLNSLKAQAADADRAASRARLQIRNLEAEARSLNSTIAANDAAERDLNDLKAELAASYAELNAAREEVDNLRRAEPSRQAQVDADQAAITALNDQVSFLNQQISGLEALIDSTVRAKRASLLRENS